MVVHVALNLHAEILGGEHQAGFAVPVVESPVSGLRVEGTAVMFVEANYQPDVVLATFDRRVGCVKRAAPRCATVCHVGELKSGEAQ